MREKILGSQDESGRRYKRAGLTDRRCRRRWARNASSIEHIYVSARFYLVSVTRKNSSHRSMLRRMR